MKFPALKELDDFQLAEQLVIAQFHVLHGRFCPHCRKKIWKRIKLHWDLRRVRSEIRRRNMSIMRIEHLPGGFESPRVQSAYETIPPNN